MTRAVRSPNRFVSVLAGVIAATHLVATQAQNSHWSGSGLIAGTIVSADSPPHPIARAIVTLASRELPRERETLTDAAGRFGFGGLPQGHFALTASKAAYIAAPYGALRPGGKGTDITLADKQILNDLKISLFKGAVISGRVTDTRGRALSGVDVQLARLQWSASGRRLASAGFPVVTNAEGYYRAFGLLPGSYLVRAGSEVDVPLRVLTAADVDGILASGRPSPAVTSDEGFRSSLIYAPGTADPDRARVVAVVAAEEVGSIDVTLFPVPAQRILGTLRNMDGEALPAVDIVIDDGLGRGQTTRTAGGSRSVPFRFEAVMPGRYRLSASSGNRPEASGPFRWAHADVVVGGGTRNAIDLTLQTGVEVVGRLGSSAQENKSPAGWFIVAVAVDPQREPAITSGPAAVGSDGSFRLNASPGRYWMTVVNQRPVDDSGRDWSVRSVLVGGVDRTDEPIELRSGENVRDLQVIVTPEPTELVGMVRTAEGQVATQHYVIAFPTDPARQIAALGTVKAVSPDSDGRYRIRGLRPGAYYVTTIGDVEQGEWFAPMFLDALVPAALRVELSHGETKTRDLRISK